MNFWFWPWPFSFYWPTFGSHPPPVAFNTGSTDYAFGRMYVLDGLALFFKRFFLLAALIVLIMSVEFADRIETGVSEFYSLILFALSGMLFASSANNFALLFVSLELITVTFYVLTSFQRSRLVTLEAGVKYLIIGALSTAFTVFGIALVYGTSGKLQFDDLSAIAAQLVNNRIFLFGLVFVLIGIGFKIKVAPALCPACPHQRFTTCVVTSYPCKWLLLYIRMLIVFYKKMLCSLINSIALAYDRIFFFK